MARKSLERLRNLLLGAILAGVCLAPAAWADGHLLANGQLPEHPSLTSGMAQPISQVLAAARATFSCLMGSPLRITVTQTPAGSHNGS